MSSDNVSSANNVSSTNNVSSANNSPSTDILATTTTARKANYRPLPVKKTTSVPVRGAKKRKHSAKQSSTRYSEGEETPSEDDIEDDGLTSGDSISSNAQASTKRQRTSRIITRSSIRIPATNEGTGGLNPPSPSLAATTEPLPAIPTADTLSSADDLSTTTVATSIGSSGFQPANTSASPITVETSLGGAVPHANIKSPSGPAGTSAEHVVEATTLARSIVITPVITPHSPPPLVLLSDIDVTSVPTFLSSHGKGRRKVDIFRYLNAVKDPHFQRILLHYIHIEASDTSGVIGSLPVAGRPVEITQWSSKARPATLPDFANTKQGFSGFVGSVFAWWSSIQPSWRTFKQGGKASRVVDGKWGTLYAPRINGLLNVVILAYWWVEVLEKQKPEDGSRADYEEFADDVAWVFSKLST